MSTWRALARKSLRSKSFWGALAGLALIAAISIYALYGTFRGGASGISLEQLRAHLTWSLVLNASLVYLADLALAITGWVLIIGTLSGLWQWPQHIRIYCINAVTRRLPGSMWYLLGRAVMYEKLGVPRSLTLIASGIEYVATLLGGLLVAILAWPLVLSQSQISPIWLLAGLALGALLLNPLVLRALIKRVSPQTHALNLRYRHLLGWILFYSLVWAGGGAILFVIANGLHPLPLTTLPEIIGVWATSALLPQLLTFLPFGLGVQEITLSALLSPLIGGPQAIVAALLMRALLTLNEVLWACIAALIRTPMAPATDQLDQPSALHTPAAKMNELLAGRGSGKKPPSLPDAEKPTGVSVSRPIIPPK